LKGKGTGLLCCTTLEMDYAVNGNSVLLEFEDIPAKLVLRVLLLYPSQVCQAQKLLSVAKKHTTPGVMLS
jgi:hypothetical protein